MASSKNEELVLDCDRDEVVLGRCCACSVLVKMLTGGFCMDNEDVIDNNPLICCCCCCCLLRGDIKLMGPFCNGDPGVMTWVDDGAVESDNGLIRAPMWLTIELLLLLLLLVLCACCDGGDIVVDGCALLLLLW